jgi:adenylyltransferase/sulfurtransferase
MSHLRREHSHRRGLHILDRTDNTTILTNDVAVFLGKPNVYASIYRFDGQVSVFDASKGPCYRCLFPEPPPPGLVPSCAEGGVLGVLPGTIGTIQATEALKVLLNIGEPLIGRLLLYDALDMSVEFVKLKKNPKCRVCGPNADITELIDYEEFCGVPGHDGEGTSEAGNFDISAADLAQRLKHNGAVLLDVREPHELAISSLPAAINIHLCALAARLSGSTRRRHRSSASQGRSARALELLASAGSRGLRAEADNAWARSGHNLPIY